MVGSKAICSVVAREAVATVVPVQAEINQPLSPPPQGIANPGEEAQLHPNLVQIPQIIGFIQVSETMPLIPHPLSQLEALVNFQLL